MIHTVIPTFNYGSLQIRRTTAEIMQGLLEFFFSNPGNISETFPSLLSFRLLEAEFENDIPGLASRVQELLSNAAANCLPDTNPLITVDSEREGTSNNYVLTVYIRSPDGSRLFASGKAVKQLDGAIDFQQLTEE